MEILHLDEASGHSYQLMLSNIVLMGARIEPNSGPSRTGIIAWSSFADTRTARQAFNEFCRIYQPDPCELIKKNSITVLPRLGAMQTTMEVDQYLNSGVSREPAIQIRVDRDPYSLNLDLKEPPKFQVRPGVTLSSRYKNIVGWAKGLILDLPPARLPAEERVELREALEWIFKDLPEVAEYKVGYRTNIGSTLREMAVGPR